MFLVSKYTLSEPKYYKKDNNKYANLTFDLMVAIFLKWPPEYTCFNISVFNPRRKTMLVSKHTFSGPRIAKKDNYKYSNLIFDYRGSHFFQNGRQNICVLLSQFLIVWCLNIHFRDQGLHKMQLKIT